MPRLQKGDYVLATLGKRRHRIRGIGWISHIYEHESGDQVAFIIGDRTGNRTSNYVFERARKISIPLGNRLHRILQTQNGTRSTLFDQIWGFLIDEHRKKQAMKWFTGNLDGRRQGAVKAKSQDKAAEIAHTSIYIFRRCFHVRDETPDLAPLEEGKLYTRPFDSDAPWTEGRCELPAKKPLQPV